MRVRPSLSMGYGISLSPLSAYMQNCFGSGFASVELFGIGKMSPMPAFYSGGMPRFGGSSRPFFSHSEDGGGEAVSVSVPSSCALSVKSVPADKGVSRDDIYRMAEQLRLEVSAFVRVSGASDESRDIFFQLAKIRNELFAMKISDLADILRSVAEDFAELKESRMEGAKDLAAMGKRTFSASGEKYEGPVDSVSSVHSAKLTDKLPADPDSLFHQDYGDLQIIDLVVHNGLLMHALDLVGSRTLVPVNSKKIAPSGSAEAEALFKESLDVKYRYFPHAVGMTYVLDELSTYGDIVKSMVATHHEDHVKSLVARCARYIMQCEYGPHRCRVLYEPSIDEIGWFAMSAENLRLGRNPFKSFPYIFTVLQKIAAVSGDDPVSLGFSRYSSDPDRMKRLMAISLLDRTVVVRGDLLDFFSKRISSVDVMSLEYIFGEIPVYSDSE